MREALYDSAWGPIAVAIAVGCLMLVATLVALARPRGAWLRERLGAYDAPGGGTATAGSSAGPSRLRLESLYGATERRFHHTRVWRSVHRLVERSNVRFSAAEALFLSAGLGLGLAVVASVLGQSGLIVLILLVVGLAIVPAALSWKANRRLKQFDEQLGDTLLTMAGSLKVGHSFTQSVQAIVDKGAPPTSEEFDRLLAETRLGQPMDEALERMAERIGSKDLEFVLMSVRIQRQVGGSLAGLFETVAETVRERQQFRRKVQALTAMARVSAYVLLALPFVTAFAITLINPGYLNPLFKTNMGNALLLLGLVGMALGAVVLRRISNVKG
jgi:tight adherence protein B